MGPVRPFFSFLIMTRSKKIFFILSLVFVILLVWASVDIASKTTFPGSKPQLKERINEKFFTTDTVKTDSISAIHR
jgi:hypothetical protein